MSALNANPWLVALGWALLHFLWQGLGLGLLGGCLLHLLRGRGPELRYILACGLLGLMCLSFLVTFGYEVGPWIGEGPRNWYQLTVAVTDGAGLAGSAWRQQLPFLLQRALPGILGAWGLGASWMLVRMGSGLLWLYGTCLREALPVNDGWRVRLGLLAADMGLRRAPRLLSSAVVDTPLVLGWLKPVILVPAAVFTGLDQILLEAVLVHELAHIRRWDFLVNLLQSFAEVLLFFHPAVWWVSRQIRREREHCCDDAAVRRCGDPLIYASALAALEALRIPTLHSIRLAPAAKGGFLMLRIRRLLAQDPAPAVVPAALPLLSAITLVLTLGIVSSQLYAQSVAAGKNPVPEVAFSEVKVKIQPPAPAYPADAKIQGIQGTVVVEFVLGAKGAPLWAKAIEGPEALRKTAEDYLLQWRFQPVRVNGKAVPARTRISMPFRLREQAPEASTTAPGQPMPVQGDEAVSVPFAQIRVVHQPAPPPYPEIAREKRIQGVVVVEITLDKDGKPKHVKAVSGPDELKAVAEDYAGAWAFEPVKVDGQAVAARFTLTMPFKLR